MLKLNKVILSMIIFSFCTVVGATCYDFGSSSNCYDSKSGNSYNIQKSGNTTYVNGHNSRAGSSWNETATTYGNTTNITGRASNGNTWNETITTIGNTTTYSGRDSQGNSFHKTCTKIGDSQFCN